MDYTKIIFVSKENVLLGPMAEWIMKSILMDKSKQIMSRGLVVLFAEPRDQRVTELLMNHGVPCEEQVSEEFHAEQVDESTLVHDEFYRKSQSSRRLWCDGTCLYASRICAGRRWKRI